MIRGGQNVNAGAHKRVLKREDVSWHGTFHCRLEGQQIKAASEGREAGQSGVGECRLMRGTQPQCSSMWLLCKIRVKTSEWCLEKI